MRSLFFMVIVSLFIISCSSISKNVTNLRHHDSNPADSSFWVTQIIDNKKDETDKVIFWRCQNYGDGPVCIQAKIVKCQAPAVCDVEVDHIDGSSKASSGGLF